MYHRVFALADFEVYSFTLLCGYYLFPALVLASEGAVFHFKPLRPTGYSLWCLLRISFVFRLSISRTSRIRFSIAVLSIPCYFTDGRYYPENVRRTAVLSCASNVKFFDFSPPQCSLYWLLQRGLLALLDKP